MSYTGPANDALSDALCRACGIDPSAAAVSGITYQHQVGRAPTLIIERKIWDALGTTVDTVAEEYTIKLTRKDAA